MVREQLSFHVSPTNKRAPWENALDQINSSKLGYVTVLTATSTYCK